MSAPSRRWMPWLLDGPVFLGTLFGIVIITAPERVGLVVVPAPSDDGVASVEAPSYLFPLVGFVIMWAALRAAAHAEVIAHRLRDPFGTLVLTLSAIFIEVILVIEVMTTGRMEDTVARDTMFASLMLILNGFVGLALVVGALKHREQVFNHQSSSAYMAMIAALCTLGLVLPRFTNSAPGGYMSQAMEVFVAGASLGLFVAFIALQSSTHRDFFVAGRPASMKGQSRAAAPSLPIGRSVVLLVVSLVTVTLLADSLGDLLVTTLRRAYLPQTLQGVCIASLILLPEGITAVRSAFRADVQRTINILHGSAVSTIGLTIPAVLIVSHLIGRDVELGLEAPEITLLAATIMVSMIQFGHGRTNVMQGIVHLMLFMLWIVLLMDDRIPAVAA